MPREKEGYRKNLEILNDRFPDQDMLKIVDVMQVFGFKTERTARKHFGPYIRFGRISKSTVADMMCPK